MTPTPARPHLLGMLACALLPVALIGCVTINVYFPAAAAEQAATEFIEKVIGEEPERSGQGRHSAPTPRLLVQPPLPVTVLLLAVSPARAQADINIRTPAVLAIQERMAERFQTQLRPHFDSGVLGLGRDGLIEIRDASALPLRERNALNQLVAEDNRDRAAVYREIAIANGRPDWEAQIRETFARQWIESARPGWYFRDANGHWQQK